MAIFLWFSWYISKKFQKLHHKFVDDHPSSPVDDVNISGGGTEENVGQASVNIEMKMLKSKTSRKEVYIIKKRSPKEKTKC